MRPPRGTDRYQPHHLRDILARLQEPTPKVACVVCGKPSYIHWEAAGRCGACWAYGRVKAETQAQGQ